MGECDNCRKSAELNRVEVFGIESFVCRSCQRLPAETIHEDGTITIDTEPESEADYEPCHVSANMGIDGRIFG